MSIDISMRIAASLSAILIMTIFKKKIVRGRAQRPAPTILEITIILEFLHRFVGAALRGRPIISHN
jgi:hypothetical protein